MKQLKSWEKGPTVAGGHFMLSEQLKKVTSTLPVGKTSRDGKLIEFFILMAVLSVLFSEQPHVRSAS